ncbi:MAG: type II toxin-antitoxin system VapC family toxin [Planctomycetes bacterium]|jgi:predicted nucleic acid-binding protein|nr:type II toxin-antitoxin system VapC family toxin [Planctomycetota bacterium]
MTRHLLDTNHLSEAVSRVSVVRDRIQQLYRQGHAFGTCGAVLCELMVGILQRKDANATRRRLDGLLKLVRVWPIDLEVAGRYGEVYLELQKAGRALSQVDIMLAAMARHASLTLLSTDQDFAVLRDIPTENWLK